MLQYAIVFDWVEMAERPGYTPHGRVHFERTVILDTQKDRETFAVVSLAGPVAECMYAGYGAQERRRRQLGCWGTDYENALASCQDLRRASLGAIGSFIARTERKASELVRYFWPSIILIAGVLERDGKASFREVAELMR